MSFHPYKPVAYSDDAIRYDQLSKYGIGAELFREIMSEVLQDPCKCWIYTCDDSYMGLSVAEIIQIAFKGKPGAVPVELRRKPVKGYTSCKRDTFCCSPEHFEWSRPLNTGAKAKDRFEVELLSDDQKRDIIAIYEDYADITKAQIARIVGCTHQQVSRVLKFRHRSGLYSASSHTDMDANNVPHFVKNVIRAMKNLGKSDDQILAKFTWITRNTLQNCLKATEHGITPSPFDAAKYDDDGNYVDTWRSWDT